MELSIYAAGTCDQSFDWGAVSRARQLPDCATDDDDCRCRRTLRVARAVDLLFFKLDIVFGAAISGLLGGFLISWIRTQSRIKADAAMALTFSTFFSLGIMLITVLKNNIDLDAFLYGNILSVNWWDVERTAIITAIVLLAMIAFYKELLFYTFDKTGAQAMGLPVNQIYFGFMAAITLTIIASMQAVGVILVVALLTVPALTATLLVKELHHILLLGAAIGLLTSVSGVYLSYYYNLPSGPTISLLSTGLFLLALFLSPSQGILTNRDRLKAIWPQSHRS